MNKRSLFLFFFFSSIAIADSPIENVVIIGSGPAGITAAIYAAQAGLHPLLVVGNQRGGQLVSASRVSNWPGNESISGKELMDSLLQHAQKAGTRFVEGEVVAVDFSQAPFMVKTNNSIIFAQSVIIATGTTPKMLKVDGEKEYWGRGISTCAICDGPLYKNKKVLVVGGGNAALEYVLSLKSFTNQITVVTSDEILSASPILREKIINDPECTVFYSTTVKRFLGDNSGVTHVDLLNKKENTTKIIPVDGVFIAIGSLPNVSIFTPYLETVRGIIKTQDQVKTSVPGVFIAGAYQHPQAIISAGLGCLAALEAEKYIKNKQK